MKNLRKQAKEVLQGAHKVYHYRKDLIPKVRLKELEIAVEEVDKFLSDKDADWDQFEAAVKRLDGLLKKIGGKIYPKTFWNDNIEIGLVAAIIVIGIRTFFFQPFIIPTNSMYPTYSGMNAVIHEPGEVSTTGARLFRLISKGAKHYDLTAENDGEVGLAITRGMSGTPRPYREIVNGRKWFGLLPAKFQEYVIYIGDQPHRIRVPVEFPLDQVLFDTLLKDTEMTDRRMVRSSDGASEVLYTKRMVEEGESILSFDITLGDALFVDRVSYHFKKPKAGDPIVFRTDEILQAVGEASGDYVPKYYIKRAAGVGGETIEIKDGVLMVDGLPRDEVAAFLRNEMQEGEYGGYLHPTPSSASSLPLLLRENGHKVKIPDGKLVALGDNSGNSLDSRYWGFVPQESLVGKAIFIYYPFTKRWGLAE